MSNLSRREREKLFKKEAILKAATKVFSQKGYHGATLEEIAEEAEFSKGALYLYFKNKEDLFYQTLEAGMQKILSNTKNATSNIENPKEALEETVKVYLTFLENNKNYFKVFWEQRLYMEKEFGDKMFQTKQKSLEFLSDIIQRCQQANLFRKDYTLTDLTSLVSGMMNGVIWNWITTDTDESLVEKANIIMDIFWNGAGVNYE